MSNEIEKKAINAVGQPLDYGEDAGQGFDSASSKDYSPPNLIVLQKGSPQCKKGEKGYVEGCSEGMLYLVSEKKPVDPELGVTFVLVRKTETFVERRVFEPGNTLPRFIGVHAVDSQAVADARTRARKDPKNAGKPYPRLFSPDGHQMVETTNLIGYMLAKPDDLEPQRKVVIPIESTKFEANKQLWDALDNVRSRKGNIPTYAMRFRVSTKVRKNPGADDSWNLDFKPLSTEKGASYDSGLIPPKLPDGSWNPLIVFGRMLNEAIKAGEITVDHGQAGDEPDAKEAPAATAGF